MILYAKKDNREMMINVIHTSSSSCVIAIMPYIKAIPDMVNKMLCNKFILKAPSVKDYFLWLDVFRVSMKSLVCGVVYKSHELKWSIVRFFSEMMHRFCQLKMTANLSFNNQSMLKEVSFFTRKWMVWFINRNIPFLCLYFSALPVWMFRTGNVGGCSKNVSAFFGTTFYFSKAVRNVENRFANRANFIKSFLGICFANQINKITFMTTKLPSSTGNPIFSNIKGFPTVFTNYIYRYHKSFQIKNALFGGLKETIRFPHLEGIKLAIKNIVPSSDLSISPRLGVSSAY